MRHFELHPLATELGAVHLINGFMRGQVNENRYMLCGFIIISFV